jgi:hypothetical protein
MTDMTGLQKLIVAFFLLTIITTCISLGLFFVDVPYKSTEKCVDNLTATNDFDLNGPRFVGSQMKDCTWTTSKDISPAHDAIINASAVCGGVFVLLSAYAYFNRKKEQDLIKKQ